MGHQCVSMLDRGTSAADRRRRGAPRQRMGRSTQIVFRSSVNKISRSTRLQTLARPETPPVEQDHLHPVGRLGSFSRSQVSAPCQLTVA